MAAWYETPEVLVSGTDRHNSLLNTRLALGDALETEPGPTGGVDSKNYLSGINYYFSNQGVAHDFSVSWNRNSGSQLNIFSELVAAFAKGPVVFHYMGGGGHALTGIGLELNDSNNNMRIDPGEAYALIIDPYNPTKTYRPNAINRAGLTDAEALDLWNTRIQAGPNAEPFLQRVAIYQDFDRTENPGLLTFNYDQTAIIPSATTGQASDGQLQFNTNEIWSTRVLSGGGKKGSLYGFVGLQRSELPDNLNNSIQPTDRETVIFNFTDFITNNQVAVELFSYFNESSEFSNDLSFYQLADTQGSILDPISGARLAPGDDGYREAALKLAQTFEATDSDSSNDDLSGRISQDAAQMGSFSFAIDALDDTALIAPLVTTSAGDTWTPFAEANRDGLNHFKWKGGLSFQVEDQFGLGDGDFNDLQAVFTTLEINGIA
jgi:hypothetical protein